MQFILFYFSATGNTKLMSKEITKRLTEKGHSVELISIEDSEKINTLNFKNKIIGFGYPVYKFTFPDTFLKFFPKFNELAENNLYFQFSTYARFTATSFNEFSKKLAKNKFRLIAEQSFKTPSCGIAARKPKTDYEYETVMFFEDNINLKLDEFVEKILLNSNKQDVKIVQKRKLMTPIILKIVKDVERTKYPKLQIDKNKCTVCGLCAKKCPDKNLEITQDNIRIIDDEHCLHCLRCMNRCPANAIVFGKLSQGENQYSLKIRDELFAKAISGHKEKYWKNFEEIRLKWRKATLKYWRQYRKNPEI